MDLLSMKVLLGVLCMFIALYTNKEKVSLAAIGGIILIAAI